MGKRSRPPRGPTGPNNDRGSKHPTNGNYKVGKGRPPIEHQWKPNQSGNKKGRKKGSKNRKTIVQAAERKLFKVVTRGRPRKLTATDMGIHHLQQDVVRGDRKAFLAYLEILERYGDEDTAASVQELLAEDQSILRNMLARMKRQPPQRQGFRS